jgi:hypothetical protein
MKVDLIACAESVVLDSPTNRISLFNLFEEFTGQIFPSIVPAIALVLMMTRTPAENGNLRLDVKISLNSKTLYERQIAANFQGNLRLRAITNIAGLPILGPGLLVFSVYLRKRRLAEWAIVVNSAPTVIEPQRAVGSAAKESSVVVRRKPAAKKKKR